MTRFPIGQPTWWLDPDRFQNLITCSFSHPKPLHKISLQSVRNFLSNIADRQTDRKIDEQTNHCYRKHNLSAKEVKYMNKSVTIQTLRHPESCFLVCCTQREVLHVSEIDWLAYDNTYLLEQSLRCSSYNWLSWQVGNPIILPDIQGRHFTGHVSEEKLFLHVIKSWVFQTFFCIIKNTHCAWVVSDSFHCFWYKKHYVCVCKCLSRRGLYTAVVCSAQSYFSPVE